MAKYIEKFKLPSIEVEENLVTNRIMQNGGFLDNAYPCNIFTYKFLTEIDFETITILYGGNGSGKSTLLNLIAKKLNLKRISNYNTSELFDDFVDQCKILMAEDEEEYFYKSIPCNSRLIASDDIFDYMISARENNQNILENTELKKDEWNQLRYGQTIFLKGSENYEEFKRQTLTRKKSLTRRKFIFNEIGKEVKLNSNGETAIDFFKKMLEDNCLYCLDEPENSLSPKFQNILVELLKDKAKYFGCQFVIATHSPFVLAIDGAKIYDLDNTPVDIKKWWQLENTKEYFNFFYKHKDLFL